MIEGVAHTLMQKRSLQPTTPQLGNRSRVAKQGNSIMNAQNAGTRFSVMLGKEAQTVLACCRYGT
jgi:fructose-specific phosphotransferase system component IIB